MCLVPEVNIYSCINGIYTIFALYRDSLTQKATFIFCSGLVSTFLESQPCFLACGTNEIAQLNMSIPQAINEGQVSSFTIIRDAASTFVSKQI